MPSGSLQVSVWRGDAGGGGFARYIVPALAIQTVLDVVTHIQREIAPDLAYRFACRVGMCGSCAMEVNGRARWTCRTHVSRVAADGLLELRPLANLPVIRDLATDMAPFFDKWARAKGAFQPKDAADGAVPDEFAVVPPASAKRQAADAGIECIGCGVCHASCNIVAWNPDHLGPAALNRAWTLVNDVRDGLSAAEIPGRTRGNEARLTFYTVLALAAGLHGAIGLRAIAAEWLGWRGREFDLAWAALGIVTAGFGIRAALGLYAA